MGHQNSDLDAIHDAFKQIARTDRDLTPKLAAIAADLRKIEALTGINRYVIREEPDLFD